MFTRRKPKLTYGSVIATIALFVALGGSSYAAITITGGNIKNGTVTGSDLKDESVKGRDVDNGTLTGSDVKNGSLTSSDIGDGTLSAADFKAGELAAGPAGPAGPPGTGALTNAVVRRTDVPLPAFTQAVGTASCANGEIAVGGGAGYGTLDPKVAILFDEPLEIDGSPPEEGDLATQWHAGANNANGPASGLNKTMTVYVVCATP
jgi:hypothetical protein